MTLIDKGCYERGCACASSKDVAGEDGELVDVVRYRELNDDEIIEVLVKITNNNEYVYSLDLDFEEVEFSKVGIFEFARAILRKAQEK